MELEKLFTTEGTKDVVLKFEGVEIPVKVRELSWSEKNQVLSQCFTYHTDKDISFNFDKYSKLVLKKIIVQAPWGETSEVFLNKIRPEFGSVLEKLVPRAFEEVETSDFFGEK